MPAELDESTSGGATERLRGRVCRERVDAGSKSERQALLLALTGGERVTLRRAGANPFRDPELEALEGQVLIVEGERRERYFLVRHYTVCDDDDRSSG
jgi:porphobilinogen deaminase